MFGKAGVRRPAFTNAGGRRLGDGRYRRRRSAGNAAAEMLRREGYSGRITMLSADESVPCDRPDLREGYLSGAAVDESNPLRSEKIYQRPRNRSAP